MLRRTLGWALMALTLMSCGDELDPASLINGPRVLGARAVIDAEPTRAWPNPGEEARIDFVVVSPAEAQMVSWGLVACPLAERSFGIDECGGEPIGLGVQTTPVALADGAPSVSFEVPADATDKTTILVAGAICFSGVPNMDFESTEPCTGEGAEGTLVAFTLPVGSAESNNAHPEVETVELNALPWTDQPTGVVPATDCAASGGEVEATEQTISLRMLSTSFESYVIETGQPPMETMTQESGQWSLFATSGQLEGLFAFSEADDPIAEFNWDPGPVTDYPASGQEVHFYFVLRDGRAGLQVIARSLCVMGTR